MELLYDFIYLLALIAYSPKIIYRAITQNRYRTGWDERLGKVRRNSPQKKCVWIHAVSVGEVNATKTLVAELKKQLPDYEIIISVTTDTGIEQARKIYGKDLRLFFYPFDFSFVVKRAFKKLKPNICLLMELEVWPNFTSRATKLNIPVVVINGRISDRSFPRYKLVRPIVANTFKKVALFLSQDQTYAKRFIKLGGRKESTVVTSSLKYDTAQVVDKVEGADKIAQQINFANQKLIVAGGTGIDEEKIIIDIFKKLKQNVNYSDVRLVVVPRKPERFNEVADLIVKSGLELTRYSKIKSGEQAAEINTSTVILGDTMGDLRKFYSLAELVFVGRSLVPMGGSDMMESTAMGKCTIFGPHTFNFKGTVKSLLNAKGAIEVADGNELYKTLCKCLDEPQFAKQIASAGQNVIKENQGATQKTVAAILGLLKK
ncbi:MAG: 3-deoxy-D-manno-octulosonic acid transferase [Planctomycetaceae bacterium]|nr:3-deoxy-D-manno-octulosonic acid transferase [Planctomycetaceae bacterium]